MAARLTSAWRGGSTAGVAGWRFTIEYDPAAIEALKTAVPAMAREWNEAERWWWVRLDYEPSLLRLMPGFEAYLRQGELL